MQSQELLRYLKSLRELERFSELERAYSLGLDPNLDPRDRKMTPVHLTASGFIFDQSADRVLLIDHKALKKWLQPGGHVDADEVPWLAAQREAFEETGFRVKPFENVGQKMNAELIPFDIDLHPIPARPEKGEDPHHHLDFRYLLCANPELESTIQVEEIENLSWFRFDKDDLPCSSRLKDTLLRARTHLKESFL